MSFVVKCDLDLADWDLEWDFVIAMATAPEKTAIPAQTVLANV
jgi:hypothetical protein